MQLILFTYISCRTDFLQLKKRLNFYIVYTYHIELILHSHELQDNVRSRSRVYQINWSIVKASLKILSKNKFISCLNTQLVSIRMRRFRDRRSPVMEVILVLTHLRWWDKANIPYMEYVVYICFRMSFAYFACQ